MDNVILLHDDIEPKTRSTKQKSRSERSNHSDSVMKLEDSSAKAKSIMISNVDIKATKISILENWRNYSPEEILGIYRSHYSNIRTLSVMISRLKKELSLLSPAPSDEYLTKLALHKQEYNQIRAQATDVRKKESLNVQVISNSDDLVLQALRYLTSNDPNLLYAALVVVTGLRPIEIAKVALFSTKLNNNQTYPAFWACQTRFAKRGTMKTKYNQCRDRCFFGTLLDC